VHNIELIRNMVHKKRIKFSFFHSIIFWSGKIPCFHDIFSPRFIFSCLDFFKNHYNCYKNKNLKIKPQKIMTILPFFTKTSWFCRFWLLLPLNEQSSPLLLLYVPLKRGIPKIVFSYSWNLNMNKKTLGE
jgi:hypothetical protein